MKPIHFKEATITLGKPSSMTSEECGNLPIFQTNDGTNVSCWRAPFWERVKFLFHGKIWLGVLSGATQPPVWVDCTETVFIKQ
jgi:hypothetical protein